MGLGKLKVPVKENGGKTDDSARATRLDGIGGKLSDPVGLGIEPVPEWEWWLKLPVGFLKLKVSVGLGKLRVPVKDESSRFTSTGAATTRLTRT